jgi:hypothetical protein
VAAVLSDPAIVVAGPPYTTDDPEPVATGHWEFYLATQHAVTHDSASGTAPHVEVNFGPFTDFQAHLIVPAAYRYVSRKGIDYGFGDIEIGGKFRFIDEHRLSPMVGTFPLLRTPTGRAAKGLGAGHPQIFIPLWVQKSFGSWTTYGGGGYWINTGKQELNFWSFGWLLQRRFSTIATLGAEFFYQGADKIGDRDEILFNLGLVLDFDDINHILMSAGRDIIGSALFQGYFAYQLTL